MSPLGKLSLHTDGKWHVSREAGIVRALAERFPGAGDLLHTPDRRQFMRLMAASLALSGLAGCDDDDPHDKIIPPVNQAAGSAQGNVLTYASSALIDGFANGVLVKTRDGRPIKIEGNPQHPWSRGGTDIFAQASVLDLYDPFRAQTVLFQTRDSDWAAFRAAMLAPQAQWRATGGEGLALLIGPTTSPTLIAQVEFLKAAWPSLQVFTHSAMPRDGLYAATQAAFGRALDVHLRAERARTIVCLDGDFLDAGPHQIGNARGWSAARADTASAGGVLPLFAATAVPNLTSAKADHPITATTAELRLLATSLLARLSGGGSPEIPAHLSAWFTAAVQSLDANRGAGIVQSAIHADPTVQECTNRLNAMLGNVDTTIFYTQPCQYQASPIADLLQAIHAGSVSALVMLGCNPIYDAPGRLNFAASMSRVALKIHASPYADETSVYADWHLPLSHPLESWFDARSADGTASLIQPTIAPLYQTRSTIEVVSLLTEPAPRSGFDLLRAHWLGSTGEDGWRAALLSGFFLEKDIPAVTVAATGELGTAAEEGTGVELLFRPDPTIWDGAFADNAWLQELPKPLSKIVWENTIQLSPVIAREIAATQGDIVTIRQDGREVTGPITIVEGQADNVACISLGYGKRATGQLSAGLGYDAFALREQRTPWTLLGITLRRTSERRVVAATQQGARLDGTNLVRLQRLGQGPVGDANVVLPSLYPKQEGDGRAWGMVIDLDTCIGCNACVVACQAENNIAVVGRDEVLNGREMHWLRIDAYARPEQASALATAFMPVPCMHCEQAPCEVGCPVEATLHDHEGLNLMVYNRCIGTRACSGYCPYKVRRFNYADYSAGAAPSIIEQRNPDVTVRAAGVMEKCTYCVQRIAEARVVSDRDNTPIPAGGVQTACQGACPTAAIAFGDLANASEQVARLQSDPRRYALLGELNTRPRTTYLAARAAGG